MAFSAVGVNTYSAVSSSVVQGVNRSGRVRPTPAHSSPPVSFSARQQASLAEIGGSTQKAVGLYQSGQHLVPGMGGQEPISLPPRPAKTARLTGGAKTSLMAYERAQKRATGEEPVSGVALDLKG